MSRGSLTPSNNLKSKLSRDELCLCMSIRLVTQPDIVLIAKAAGFDAIYIDLEHGNISPEACSRVAVTSIAAGIACLVRVPRIDEISKVLDGGASGVICPNIANADEAKAVVQAAKFPPIGKRGVAASFPNYGYQPVPASDSLPALNEASMVVLQIESVDGLNNIETIAETNGVDMLLVGTNDLLADMGLAGQFEHEKLKEAFAKISVACKRQSITFGIGGLSSHPSLVASLVAMGGSFISVGSDIGFLANAARAKASELRTLDQLVGHFGV